MIKLDELKQDPKVKDVSDKASDAYQQAKDYIVPKTKETHKCYQGHNTKDNYKSK